MVNPPGVSDVTPALQTAAAPTYSHLNLWSELTCVALILMELCWIAPLYYLLARFSTGINLQQSFVILGVILLGAYAQARLTGFMGLNSFSRIGIFAFYLFISLLVGLRVLAYYQEAIGFGETIVRFVTAINHIDIWIPKEFGVCLTVILLGLNGFSLAADLPDPFRVHRRFWSSILMLLVFGLFSLDEPDAMPPVLLYLFLAASLLAMSASRLALVGRLRGGQRIPFDLKRTLVVGVFGVGMASLSLLAAFLFRSQPLFSIIYSLFLFIVRVIALGITILMLPIYLILYYVIPDIRLPDSIVRAIQILIDLIHQFQLLFSGLPRINLSGFFHWLLSLKPLVLWSLLTIGLAAILLLVRSFLHKKQPLDAANWQESDLSGDLLRDMRAGLRKRIALLVERLAKRLALRPTERLQAAARIRRIYTELIELSARMGSPRPASYTPLEYLPLLNRQLPLCSADLELITQAYNRIRYGELPEYHEQLTEIEAAWARVKEAFQKK
jgi:hypothetical protein